VEKATAAASGGRKTVPIPAECPAVQTSIEGVNGGYRSTAILTTKATESQFFRDRTYGTEAEAYAAAKRFLQRFERSCPECQTHFGYGAGARCECGACEGGAS